MKQIWKILTVSFRVLTIFLVATAIALQVEYESYIDDARKSCSYLAAKKRQSYIPVIVYWMKYFLRDPECRKDRLISNTVFNKCETLPLIGYASGYIVHVFLTQQERDALVIQAEDYYKIQ